MARKMKVGDPNQLRQKLIDLLTDFERHLQESDLREQVRKLVPVNYTLRDLGGSLLPDSKGSSARERILAYLLKYPCCVIDGEELMVVAGISEYGRRIRELRVQQGWPILSGTTAREQSQDLLEGELPLEDAPPKMKPDQYMLVSDKRDREAADRWFQAHQIRNGKSGVRDKLLQYFKSNVGKQITSEELRYVAKNRSEWARRARELRTEDGWPIITRNSGDPSLPVGVYVMASNQQAPEHDRKIPELTRREVMLRDHWSCRWEGCGWPRGFDTAHDHRFLEVHHIEHHASGGSNEAENLVTLCNLHHDEVHRTNTLKLENA